MRRRRSWIDFFLWLVLLAGIGYGWLSLVLPPWVRQQVSRLPGGELTVGPIHVGFPFSVSISDVAFVSGTPGTVLTIHRIIARPVGISWRRKTVWLSRLALEEPHLQFHRTQQGMLEWPPLDRLSQLGVHAQGTTPQSAPTLPAGGATWRAVIHTLQISEGVLEFLDQHPAKPFRGVLSHLSFVGGPIAWPFHFDRCSLAIQGQLIGDQQHSAPAYCSGWIDLQAKNLEVSCKLDPLRLAAFEPYYDEGPLQVRVYDATLEATTHLTAKSNALDGRVQLMISHLSEADLSYQGRAIADIKKLVGGSEGTLRGEIQITGQLDHPKEWQVQLVPGNEVVQRLVSPLVARGIEIIQIKVGTQTIQVGLAPATEAAKSSMEATSQTVKDTLQVLAPTPPPPQGPAAEPTPPLSPEPSPHVVPQQPGVQQPAAPAPGQPAPLGEQPASSVGSALPASSSTPPESPNTASAQPPADKSSP